ncbi:MAG: exonuclease domain-containing protein [Methylobacter sp.]|uniref:3'-5' exonuclease family protein n=1 Tax=Methylobacter sp. TaxID=2051955 RepID=UPI002731FAE5|nr:3'-5' exonuclease family protein [Methylobacter sp.]MDP1666271.1 exonuclease domain-containing protein [Methylobacter sp.]
MAFVDLETTGAKATVDRITEIGVVLVDEDGVHEWSRLIQPQTRIPPFIEQLTGITNAMVADAPRFEAVAKELAALLHGYLFIAHNARFDYSFLKNEFKYVGLTFQPDVLCTVKLSRALFPAYPHHNLDSLIERYGLNANGRHRALADAQLIHQFWQKIHLIHDPALIAETVKKLVGRSSLPSNIDRGLIDDLPDSPGVYLFYGENDLPLYIGKSINIRQRVLAHFSADHSHGKEMSLSQQLRRIEWIETAGELGALLMEAKLIKTLQPIHNRRLRRNNALCAWQLQQHAEHLRPVLTWADDLDFGAQSNLHGLYHSQRDAQKALRSIADQNQLCLSVLGIEKTAKGRPCFAQQLKKCKGACIGQEKPLDHAARLLIAMNTLKLATWTYPGAVGIQEGDEIHVIDHWCYLGTAKNEVDVQDLLDSSRPAFDRDTYLILSKALKKPVRLIHVDRGGRTYE